MLTNTSDFSTEVEGKDSEGWKQGRMFQGTSWNVISLSQNNGHSENDEKKRFPCWNITVLSL